MVVVSIDNVQVYSSSLSPKELVLFCYRCSSTNFVMTSRHNRCTNCEHQFHRSFYSFDVLPLVEFEIEVSHARFLELINGSTVANNNNNGEDDGQQHHQQETIESNRQTLELGHSSVDTTNQQINILNLSKNVNEATNLIVLGEQHLSRLSSHQASVIIHENRYDGTHRYFINMMPELSITSCAVCNKVSPLFTNNPFSPCIIHSLSFYAIVPPHASSSTATNSSTRY